MQDVALLDRPGLESARRPRPALLHRVGLPRLWGADVERAWSFMRWWVAPATMLLAPGSYGYGLDRLPSSGGFVLAANHLSALDPPLIGSFSRRAVCWMMKEELLEIPLAGELLTFTGAFPIRRGGADREAIRTACELLADGHVVGVFVEGTRQRLGYPGPAQLGAVMVARRVRVPIVPCGVESFGWSLRAPRACAVVFGHPMDAELAAVGSGSRGAASLLEGAIQGLWRQAAEAVADGFPATLPDGARRGCWIKPGHEVRAPAPRRVSGLVRPFQPSSSSYRSSRSQGAKPSLR